MTVAARTLKVAAMAHLKGEDGVDGVLVVSAEVTKAQGHRSTPIPLFHAFRNEHWVLSSVSTKSLRDNILRTVYKTQVLTGFGGDTLEDIISVVTNSFRRHYRLYYCT